LNRSPSHSYAAKSITAIKKKSKTVANPYQAMNLQKDLGKQNMYF